MVTPLTTLSHFDPNFTIEGYENIDILNYDPIAPLDSNATSEEAATILSLGQQVMAVLGSVAVRFYNYEVIMRQHLPMLLNPWLMVHMGSVLIKW